MDEDDDDMIGWEGRSLAELKRLSYRVSCQRAARGIGAERVAP